MFLFPNPLLWFDFGGRAEPATFTGTSWQLPKRKEKQQLVWYQSSNKLSYNISVNQIMVRKLVPKISGNGNQTQNDIILKQSSLLLIKYNSYNRLFCPFTGLWPCGGTTLKGLFEQINPSTKFISPILILLLSLCWVTKLWDIKLIPVIKPGRRRQTHTHTQLLPYNFHLPYWYWLTWNYSG